MRVEYVDREAVKRIPENRCPVRGALEKLSRGLSVTTEIKLLVLTVHRDLTYVYNRVNVVSVNTKRFVQILKCP